MGAKYTEAQARASAKYQKEKVAMISLKLQKPVKEAWKIAADRNGVALQRFIVEAVEDRIAREAAQEAAALGQVITALAEAHSKPYTVTFHTLEQLPTGRTKLASGDAQKVVEASSEADAKVVFFKWLKEQMQTEVAFEDSTMIGMKRDDGVIEICEIVSVE